MALRRYDTNCTIFFPLRGEAGGRGGCGTGTGSCLVSKAAEQLVYLDVVAAVGCDEGTADVPLHT